MANIKKDIIIGVGDTHFPFHSKKVLAWALDLIKHLSPQIKAIVQVGDLYDYYSFTRFPKRLTLTPREETFEARYEAELFWEKVHKAAPKALYYQLKGNHDARLMKRVVESMPELEHMVIGKNNEMFEFDRVKTIEDDKITLELNGWHFIHGHTGEGKHIEAVDFQNVCLGHTHRGGAWSRRLHRSRQSKVITELNCGYLGDPHSDALVYRPMKKHFKWTQGVGIIDKWGGRFIPYQGNIK